MTARTHVELMRILDEKFVKTTIEFEAMWPTATVIIDSAPFRGSDGTLDRDRVQAAVMAVGERFVETRLRVVYAPLGLTTPLWVPAGPLDRDYHASWFPRVPAREEEGALFGGRANMPRRLDRPLWRCAIVERLDGDLVIVGSLQHALGDALFSLKFIDALITAEPVEPQQLGRAPRTRAGALLVVWWRWLRARSGPRDAWREYWRKPLRKRLRRWGGRLLRPARNRAIDRRGLRSVYAPPMTSAYWSAELAPTAKLASRLGGSVSDLVTALTLRALARLEPDREASVSVPVSRRRREANEVRNSILMLRVTVPRDALLAEMVAAVHAQVIAFGRSGEGDTTSSDSDGYVTYVPYRREPATLRGAAVRQVVLWPTPTPGSRFGLFASSYAGELVFAARCAPPLDVEALREAIEDELTDAAAALAAEDEVAS